MCLIVRLHALRNFARELLIIFEQSNLLRAFLSPELTTSQASEAYLSLSRAYCTQAGNLMESEEEDPSILHEELQTFADRLSPTELENARVNS